MVPTLAEHEKLIASVCYYKIRKFAKISAHAAASCATFGTWHNEKNVTRLVNYEYNVLCNKI